MLYNNLPHFVHYHNSYYNIYIILSYSYILLRLCNLLSCHLYIWKTMLSCIATPNHPWHQRHYHYIHWVRTTRQCTIIILSFQKIESLLERLALFPLDYIHMLIQHYSLYDLICYSNFLFLSSQGFVKLL